MSTPAPYPLKVEGELEPQLSRALWLVKWLLLIPHYFVLFFLWLAFALLSVIAFFAILFTGRYPRGVFGFNVGVIRWTWRVSYYGYSALATDRYPPFTLDEVPDYPTHLDVEYPERLSRGLVLVKWWLLAIPHYIIVSVLSGGAYYAVRERVFLNTGLIEILVLVAALALLFTGGYPRSLFDLIVGLNRWVLRVVAYAGLMTDVYPPFRLDQGGSERLETTPSPAPPSGAAQPAEPRAEGPTAGSIVALIIGALIALTSLGLLAGGSVLLWVDRTQRDGDFVTTPTEDFSTSTYALATEGLDFRADGPRFFYPSNILGDARVSATSNGGEGIFIGIGRTALVEDYLDEIAYAEVRDFIDGDIGERPGDAPPGPPTKETLWEYSVAGDGPQEIVWDIGQEDWTIVVMNEDGSQGVDVAAEAGAELPGLPWFALGLVVAGLATAAVGTVLIVYGTRHGRRTPDSPESNQRPAK